MSQLYFDKMKKFSLIALGPIQFFTFFNQEPLWVSQILFAKLNSIQLLETYLWKYEEENLLAHLRIPEVFTL